MRGFRIELGEIEAALAGAPGGARGGGGGARRTAAARAAGGLCGARERRRAPIAAELRGAPAERAARVHGAGRLRRPAGLPLTPNGKVDRKALPAPERRRRFRSGCVAPRTPLEAYWPDLGRDVLEVETIGAFDDFFALGGTLALPARC